MQKAGGIVAIIAGILGLIACGLTFWLAVTTTSPVDGFSPILQSGVLGIVFSFVVIVLGAVGMNIQQQRIGIMLSVSAVIGALLGGWFVAVPMILALVGGILVTIGARRIPSL